MISTKVWFAAVVVQCLFTVVGLAQDTRTQNRELVESEDNALREVLALARSPERLIAESRFELSEQTEDRVAGLLEVDYDSQELSFSSLMVTPTLVKLRLELGGVVLEAEAELEANTRALDGHGHELSVGEHLALAVLSAHLNGHLRPFDDVLPPHEELLLQAVSFWAQAPVGGPLLDIKAHASDEIAGDFWSTAHSMKYAGSLDLTFSSRLETPSRVVIQLQLGEHLLEADVDLEQRIALLQGSGRAMSADELQVLNDFAAQYERYLTPDHRVPLPHEDMFYRMLSIWAQHPPGWPIESYVVSAPATIRAMPPVEPAHERFSYGGSGPICGGPNDDEEFFDCQLSGGSIHCALELDLVIPLEGGCQCNYYELWHSHPDGHPFGFSCCGEIQGAGCDLASGCQGKCGTSCTNFPDCELGGTFGAGIYTYDCAEHDRCVRLHGTFDLFCQDEFLKTFNDCAFGLPIFWNCDGCGEGICCFEGACFDQVTQAECEEAGGTWQPGVVSCPTSGACLCGEINDCNGNCVPTSWVGDGFCDDGSFEWHGVPIFLNCDEFSCDGGDCSCDGICCFQGGCFDQVTQAECKEAGGAWQPGVVSCPTSGACLCGEINDCNGNCVPTSWVGDGFCDDGSFEWHGVPIFLNCCEFDCDGGDCPGCGLPVSIDHVSWDDEDDPSTECPGQDQDGVPESGEFGAFNIHLQNTSGIPIPDQGCEVRVLNSSLGNSIDELWHDYPAIPVNENRPAVSPWHITGNRIPCTFCGLVTADVTIRCGEQEETLQGYGLFEVVPPEGGPTPICGDGTCNCDETPANCCQDCGSTCGDGSCDAGCGEDTCSCPQDCGSSCGDGCCNGNETACSCPQDGCAPVCGDGCCNGDENACTCPQDGCEPICGDGCCNDNETACSCPSDGCPATCGDGCCNGNETACACPQDGCQPTCGDGCCNGDETCETCPQECDPVCGDGICECGESSDDCCQDCPCPDEHPCVDGKCDGRACDLAPYTIGGAVYDCCDNPLTCGVEGVEICVECEGGFQDCDISEGGAGLWQISGVPCETCTVSPPLGYCHVVDQTCPPDPCENPIEIEVCDENMPDNQSIGLYQACMTYDMNGDGFPSIIGDVPCFVGCVYFNTCVSEGFDACTSCPCDDPNLVCRCDCNCDGFCSIIGDVPCFVDCIYFGNCVECTAASGGDGGEPDGFKIGGAVFEDRASPLASGVVGVKIKVLDSRGRVAGTTTSGELGLWKIEGLTEGKYVVIFGNRQHVLKILVSEVNKGANQSITWRVR